MPSIRINPKDGCQLSYRQVQKTWLQELKQTRKGSSSAATSPGSSNAGVAATSPVFSSSSFSTTGTLVAGDLTASSSSISSVGKPSGSTTTGTGTVASVSDIELSEEQLRVFRKAKAGKNVFFTGPAGTGKSVLLRAIVSWAIELYRREEVAITASTGIAGLNINGTTLHSWAGIGLGKEPKEKIAKKIAGSTRILKRWRETKILIIDEISMVDGTLFDKLDYIGRAVRNPYRPFGGLQLIVSGDFFQLPPVPDQSHNYKQSSTFAFEAKQWNTCIDRPMFLQQVFRQRDTTFIDLLSSIRLGQVTDEHVRILRSLQRPIVYEDGIGPTLLYPLKVEVEAYNNKKLSELEGAEFRYDSTDSGGFDPYGERVPNSSVHILLDRMIALGSVTLKINSQVMLIQNVVPKKLVNGSTGKVVEFLTIHEALERDIMIAELNESRSPSSDKGRPERSKEEVLRDVTKQLEHAEGLQQINDNHFSPQQYWPLVRFTNGMELLCAPLAFSVQGFIGNIEAHRLQVPLILSWALSIHKAQGQTLERVKVNLGQVFENGQAYVALSRATSMEGLEIEDFQPSKIRADHKVAAWQQFYSALGWEEDPMDSEEALRSFWGY